MINKEDTPLFAVLGGDLRQATVASELVKSGYRVRLFGFETYTEKFQGVCSASTLEKALKNVNYVILPLPYSTDGITLNAPYSDTPQKLSEIYANIRGNTVVLGGKFSCYELNKRGIKTIDYFQREELQILNAIPTAEGALQIAMEEYSRTIHDSNCLVVGYGRIGKVLAEILRGVHAKVEITARKFSDKAWINTNGFKAHDTKDIENIIEDFDIVFNTVPAPVIGKNEIEKTKKDVLFIDLASKPGGIDFETAREMGRHTVWSLSLPGKVAPITAGKIIKQTIMNILSQEEGYGV